jgi:hypothetical protein
VARGRTSRSTIDSAEASPETIPSRTWSHSVPNVTRLCIASMRQVNTRSSCFCPGRSAVPALRPRICIDCDRDHKQKNAEIHEVVRDNTRRSTEQACADSTEPQGPVNDCHSRTHAAESVGTIRRFLIEASVPPRRPLGRFVSPFNSTERQEYASMLKGSRGSGIGTVKHGAGKTVDLIVSCFVRPCKYPIS